MELVSGRGPQPVILPLLCYMAAHQWVLKHLATHGQQASGRWSAAHWGHAEGFMLSALIWLERAQASSNLLTGGAPHTRVRRISAAAFAPATQ